MLAFVIGSLFSVAGLACSMYSVTLFRKGTASRLWPSVKGTITRCEIIRLRAGVNNVALDIRFEYKVLGKAFSGTKAAWYGITTVDVAEHVCSRFPEGEDVSVYYCPNSPEQAVLIPGWREENRYHEFWVCGIVTVVGLAVATAHLHDVRGIFLQE